MMITGKKLIASLSVEDLQAEGYVNGLKLLDDLLTSSTHQDIAGNSMNLHSEWTNRIIYENR